MLTFDWLVPLINHNPTNHWTHEYIICTHTIIDCPILFRLVSSRLVSCYNTGYRSAVLSSYESKNNNGPDNTNNNNNHSLSLGLSNAVDIIGHSGHGGLVVAMSAVSLLCTNGNNVVSSSLSSSSFLSGGGGGVNAKIMYRPFQGSLLHNGRDFYAAWVSE